MPKYLLFLPDYNYIYKPMLDFEDKNLKTFFLAHNQPMLIADDNCELILAMNDTAIKITDFSDVEIVPQAVETILHAKKQQHLWLIKEASAQKQFKKELSLISKTGKITFVEAVITPILYRGTAARLFTMTDITEKKLYRSMLEDAFEEDMELRAKNQQLKKIAYLNLHLARKPLANILGLVNVIDLAVISDQTLAKAIGFLRESGQELNEVIKGIDPQLY